MVARAAPGDHVCTGLRSKRGPGQRPARLSITAGQLAAQEKLAQASRLAAVAELSASIAHELNQPLQAIVAHGRACVRWLAATPPKIEEAKYSAEQVLPDANSAAGSFTHPSMPGLFADLH